jgi:nucleoid DNA-binding protein
MTKRELAVRIANETGMPQEDVQAIIQKTLDYMTEALVQGRHIEFRDFGVFEICVRKARVGRNPNKPEVPVQIPERRTVKFKPGKLMREQVLQSKPPA